ncbi:hypothetical protein ES704_01400 [subsurface metagenome]|jgi:hypothetical protein
MTKITRRKAKALRLRKVPPGDWEKYNLSWSLRRKWGLYAVGNPIPVYAFKTKWEAERKLSQLK